uniref:Uncharacterized protein n=1 Tax=Meloidogyne enterolobii TaxID=390850 RepID=A0A6V7VH08_MELEN|nr:unnamed protein product [Meloidogyne enterolobii]
MINFDIIPSTSQLSQLEVPCTSSSLRVPDRPIIEISRRGRCFQFLFYVSSVKFALKYFCIFVLTLKELEAA